MSAFTKSGRSSHPDQTILNGCFRPSADAIINQIGFYVYTGELGPVLDSII